MDVDDPGVDALFGQLLGGGDGFPDHQAGGDDGQVLAVPEGDAFAQLEVVGLRVVEHRHGQAAEADVDRPVVVDGGLHGGAGFHVVGGAQDHHAGEGAHQGEVLAALVGGAVLAHGDAGVGGADLHVEVGVGDGVADDLKGPAGGEHGEGAGENSLPGGGHTGGHAHHVFLGDAAVKEALRAGFLEDAGLGGGGQVGVQDDEFGVFGSQLRESFAVAFPGGDFFQFRHGDSFLSTLIPLPGRPGRLSARSWPSRTAPRWEPRRARRPDSP